MGHNPTTPRSEPHLPEADASAFDSEAAQALFEAEFEAAVNRLESIAAQADIGERATRAILRLKGRLIAQADRDEAERDFAWRAKYHVFS